jgi:GDSL-like Lipase/Acylhydrolase
MATMGVVVLNDPTLGTPLQGTQVFSQFLGFGDSNIDSGYFFTHNISNNQTLLNQYRASVAAGGGIPTSLGGKMVSELLAADYGLTATPLGIPGGTNYAASGATVTGGLPNSLAPSIVSQIQAYLNSTGNHADPNALYLISGGGNDAKIAATLSGAAQTDYMVQQAHALAHAIEQLYAAGARYIVSLDRSGTGSLGTTFTDTLWSDLADAGIQFIPGQTIQNVIVPVSANPAAFGIVNAVRPPAGPFNAANPYDPADGGADINPLPNQVSGAWALYATQMVSPNAGSTYLWADNEHPAAAGQQLEANYLYGLVQHATPVVSETLTANANVVGDSSAHFTYQWQSLTSGQATWHNLQGATASTYAVQRSDVGSQIRVDASYVDSGGHTTTEQSQPTPLVAMPASAIQDDFSAITRASLPVDQASSVASAINLGSQTEFHFVNDLLTKASNTTIPAVAVEASMYGTIGTSNEVSFLANTFLPPQITNALEHGFNPLVYSSEALGLAFAFGNESGSIGFANAFGPSNSAMPNSTSGDAAFAAAAIAAIFGSAATSNLTSVMQTFVANWKAFYTGSGIPGVSNPTLDQIDLAARGAAWGDAVGVALANDLGPLKGQATNFLMDAAEGMANYSMSLVGQPVHHPFQGEM